MKMCECNMRGLLPFKQFIVAVYHWTSALLAARLRENREPCLRSSSPPFSALPSQEPDGGTRLLSEPRIFSLRVYFYNLLSLRLRNCSRTRGLETPIAWLLGKWDGMNCVRTPHTCACVCMCVCLSVCLYVGLSVCLPVRACARPCASVRACVRACECACARCMPRIISCTSLLSLPASGFETLSEKSSMSHILLAWATEFQPLLQYFREACTHNFL